MRLIAPLVLPLVVAALALATNLTQHLGAHPWWADKVVWIGLPVGLALAAVASALKLARPVVLGATGMLAIIGFAVAQFGKFRFAASYAEDALAAHMWYYGWIATCALTAAMLASLALRNRQNH